MPHDECIEGQLRDETAACMAQIAQVKAHHADLMRRWGTLEQNFGAVQRNNARRRRRASVVVPSRTDRAIHHSQHARMMPTTIRMIPTGQKMAMLSIKATIKQTTPSA